MSRINQNKIFKLISILIIIILFVKIINDYGLTTLRNQIETLGPIAPLGVFILRFSSVIIPALPGTAYSILAGTLLGFNKGLFIICLSDLISCSLSFSISRRYGRNLVTQLIGRKFMNRIERLSSMHLENNFFLMTGLLMTGLFDFVSYAIGLTETKWTKFMPALIISILISNPPIVALGAGLLEGGKIFLILGILGFFILAILTAKLKQSKELKF
tara:strand:- start:639 stop:1286 length:648 start_codon:yes stop_codon:yes gene_type:complete